jgi:hypothetical protein
MLDFVAWPAPDGGLDARTGWAGMMKPAGRSLILMTSLTMQLAV